MDYQERYRIQEIDERCSLSQIQVTKKDNTSLRIEAEISVLHELNEFFAFYAKGYKFSPQFKNGNWDGRIKIFNLWGQSLPLGLFAYLQPFADERNYSVVSDQETANCFIGEQWTEDQAREYMKTLNLTSYGKPIDPLPHQLTAVAHCVSTKRATVLSPTASGKSLIVYTLCRYFLDNLESKTLIIVPTTSLVKQLESDFKDYASNDTWNDLDHVQTIYQGQSKKLTKQIVISTWQSLYKEPKEFFDGFGAVLVDETHLAKAKSFSKILNACINAEYRFGFTGTMDGVEVHRLTVEGLLGPIRVMATTSDLMDQKLLANLKIRCVTLVYPEKQCKLVKGMEYKEEMDWLIANVQRNNFIRDLTYTLKGNTLVIFEYVEKHGKILYEMIRSQFAAKAPHRKVMYISGETDVVIREEFRKATEAETDAVIVASAAVFSTGVNIRRLHNIILASSTKSSNRIRQTIGRQLRLAGDKDFAYFYDISDDLTYKKKQNYTIQHAIERMKLYELEKFDVHYTKIRLKDLTNG